MSDGCYQAHQMVEEAKKRRRALRGLLRKEDPDGSRRRRVREAFVRLEYALDDLPKCQWTADVKQLVRAATDKFLITNVEL